MASKLPRNNGGVTPPPAVNRASSTSAATSTELLVVPRSIPIQTRSGHAVSITSILLAIIYLQ